MARQIITISAQVGQMPVQVKVFEFPIIEDLVNAMIIEAMFTRRQRQPMSTRSPVGRDTKDFLIKSNVVGE